MEYRDYHLHTEFSFDSSEKIENICEKAVMSGIKEIALTDHLELPLTDKTPFPDLEKRCEVIRKCQELYPQLSILSGLEIGQPWRGGVPDNVYTSLDFVIVSVHSPDGYQDVKYADLSSEDEVKHLLDTYLSQMISMAKMSDYDVLAHVTFLFRYISEEAIQKYPPESFRDAYAELFTAVIDRGKGIEVNCSGLRMPTIGKTLPSLELLKLYRNLGGEIVTVGSDGHSCRSAFSGIAEGYAVLRQAGFQYAASFSGRKAAFYSIKEVS